MAQHHPGQIIGPTQRGFNHAPFHQLCGTCLTMPGVPRKNGDNYRSKGIFKTILVNAPRSPQKSLFQRERGFS